MSGPSAEFSVEQVLTPDHLTVKVHGDIDAVSATVLLQRLRDAVARSPETIVDLADVTFIDSAGVQALVDAHRHALALGTRLYVENARGPVGRTLSVSGASSLLTKPT